MSNDRRDEPTAAPPLKGPVAFLRRRRKLILELWRFGLVGVAGFVVDIAVLQLYLATVGDLLIKGDAPYCGQALAWFVAATSNWWLNRQFTFRNHVREPHLPQWARFIAVNTVGGLMNFAVYSALVTFFTICRNFPVIAVLFGTAVSLIFNFTGSRKLVFKPLA